MTEKKAKKLNWAWDYFTRLKEGNPATIKAKCNFCSEKLSNNVGRFVNHLVKDVSFFLFMSQLREIYSARAPRPESKRPSSNVRARKTMERTCCPGKCRCLVMRKPRRKRFPNSPTSNQSLRLCNSSRSVTVSVQCICFLGHGDRRLVA